MKLLNNLLYLVIIVPLTPIFIHFVKDWRKRKNSIKDVVFLIMLLSGALIYDSWFWFIGKMGTYLNYQPLFWMRELEYNFVGKMPVVIASWVLFFVWRKRR